MADILLTGTTLVEKESRSIGDVPIGGIVAWLKTLSGVPNLAEGWVECDGATLVDALSPLNGQTIPNLNGGNRFLRGNSTSGGTSGAATHNHTLNSADIQQSTAQGGTELFAINTDQPGTSSSSSLPPAYDVIWIMRVR